MQANTLLSFWFEEIDPTFWFKKSLDFDHVIAQRFSRWHHAATQGELAHWRKEIGGRLAEIIILDQFSRQLFRDQPQAFAFDGMALILAQEAVNTTLTHQLSPTQRAFLYMPFMHSESSLIHQQALPLFESLGLADTLKYELKHKEIIDRFGRYPHRNAILGRLSTEEELNFLQQPGSSF